MSTYTPPNSSLTAFTQRKRIYVACVHCRKRKVKCVNTGDSSNTPCKRCAEKGLLCEYLAVCEEDERDNFGGPLQPPPPSGANRPHSWKDSHNGSGGPPRPPSVAYGNNGHGQQNASQFNSQYPQQPAPQFNYAQPSASQFPSNFPSNQTNAGPRSYSNRQPAQPQYSNNPSYSYASNTYPTPTQPGHYSSSGIPPQQSASGYYDSSNFYPPDPGYQGHYG
ncbi:hypothetical protein B0H19DRAFT_1078128 [Mycena capillaripes]|nr:hypothetical protein B0H19DRAFT_1078128 [Mycena capillaripes]